MTQQEWLVAKCPDCGQIVGNFRPAPKGSYRESTHKCPRSRCHKLVLVVVSDHRVTTSIMPYGVIKVGPQEQK